MARRTKKGVKGNAAKYITRTQAVRKLQLKLADFRKLCILKGIHPREPKKKVLGQDKTYYHTKDINALLYEPVLDRLREQQAHEKKIRKALGKQNVQLAKRLQQATPGYKLDKLVKERYPSFLTALRDLDDCLTLLHLFAVLPAEAQHSIPRGIVDKSRLLSLHLQAYLVRCRALRKVFVSVRGWYFQASIQNQPVTWLVPHQVGQSLPGDVDFRVMLTFAQFYHTMLAFVLFKLYNDLRVRYPPNMDANLDTHGAGLAAILATLPSADGGKDAAEQQPQQQEQQSMAGEGPSEQAADVAQPEHDPAMEPEARECGALFEGLVFYLGREVPKDMLGLVICAFGGKVGWQGPGSPVEEDDASITHQVTDRPALRSSIEGRVYVQPQWVLDSANWRVLLPVERYAVGATLPPHVSPFQSLDDEDEHVPDYARFLQELQDAAKQAQDAGGSAAFNAEAVAGDREDDGDAVAAAEAHRQQQNYEKELQQELEISNPAAAGQLPQATDTNDERQEDAPKPAKRTKVSAKGGLITEDTMAQVVMSRKQRKLYENLKSKELAKAEKKKRLAVRAAQLKS